KFSWQKDGTAPLGVGISILDLATIEGIEPGVGLSNWVDHVKTWQYGIDSQRVTGQLLIPGDSEIPKKTMFPTAPPGSIVKNLPGRMSYP
ncbi:hypothetical protein LTS06_012807, partial [Exophiala xenobiotica]